MTYTPVENPVGGRTPLPIPDALIRQLEHSAATGARCEIALTPEDDPEAVAELRRTLIRAAYRLFRGKTVHKRFTPERITFWVTDKRPAPKKRASRKKTKR